MKIAIVSPWAISSSAVGGTERFIVDLAESMTRSGHDVDVLMFSGINHDENGVHYKSIDLFGSGTAIDEYVLRDQLGDFAKEETYQSIANKIENIVDGEEYDVMHINTQLLLRAWTHKRRIFTIHTNPFEYKQAWGDDSYAQMINIARSQSTCKDTLYTAPSQHYANLFSNEMDAAVSFIPHAIDPTRIVSHKSRKELIEQYALDESKLHILLPSRLEPVQKQPGLLFDALQYLPKELLARVEILSSGVDEQYREHQHQFTKQATELGCTVFFGRFESMSDAYKMADVVVLPSKSESFGYSALESLATGLPTILNDIPTFHEIADRHPSAYFFGNDSQELASILQVILTSDTMRRQANTSWYNRYDIEPWAKQYEELM